MWRSSLVVALALGVVLPSFAGSARGAVAAHELVRAESTSSSANKSITATCPAGKQLLGGGGAKTFGAGGQVSLAALRPNSTLTAFTATGVEDENGFAGSWTVSAWAICARPPIGLQRVTATSAASSANKGITATCPTGKKVLGAGGEITGGGGQVTMSAIRPSSTLTAVTVNGAEDGNGFSGSWSVIAYAICATPPAGLQRVVAASSSDSQPDKFIPATCPANKRVVGTGGEITGGAGQVVIGELIPAPPPDPTQVFTAGFEDENGYTGNWTVTAYAICAPISRRVVAATGISSSNKTAVAFCDGGLQTTGVGGDINGGAGRVVLDGVSPEGASIDEPPTESHVTGFEDTTGFGGNWFVRAYAICATPPLGLELVTQESGLNSGSANSVFARCPSGKNVIGAGGDIQGGEGHVVLDEIIPNPSLTDVTATAYEDPNGYTATWQLVAYALCAPPPAGLQRVSVQSPTEFDPGSVTATCPGSKNLLGGGVELNGATGRVVLDDMRPDALLKSVTATGLVGGFGIVDTWSITAYAICANP